MKIKVASLLAIIFNACIACETNSVNPLSDNRYINRGDRCEGRKENPQNPGNESPVLELVSARVDYEDGTLTSLPTKLKVAFYSPQKSTSKIVVREVQPNYSYWMTRTSECKDGFGNVFQWLTQPILAKLGLTKMYELGVVIRLGDLKQDSDGTIAPAIFYHEKPAKNA